MRLTPEKYAGLTRIFSSFKSAPAKISQKQKSTGRASPQPFSLRRSSSMLFSDRITSPAFGYFDHSPSIDRLELAETVPKPASPSSRALQSSIATASVAHSDTSQRSFSLKRQDPPRFNRLPKSSILAQEDDDRLEESLNNALEAKAPVDQTSLSDDQTSFYTIEQDLRGGMSVFGKRAQSVGTAVKSFTTAKVLSGDLEQGKEHRQAQLPPENISLLVVDVTVNTICVMLAQAGRDGSPPKGVHVRTETSSNAKYHSSQYHSPHIKPYVKQWLEEVRHLEKVSESVFGTLDCP